MEDLVKFPGFLGIKFMMYVYGECSRTDQGF